MCIRDRLTASPGHERQQDEGVEPQGIAQVGRGPGGPGVAQGERERPGALQGEAATEIPGHRGVHARELEGDDDVNRQGEVGFVEQQDDQVERARKVVAVQSPGCLLYTSRCV